MVWVTATEMKPPASSSPPLNAPFLSSPPLNAPFLSSPKKDTSSSRQVETFSNEPTSSRQPASSSRNEGQGRSDEPSSSKDSSIPLQLNHIADKNRPVVLQTRSPLPKSSHESFASAVQGETAEQTPLTQQESEADEDVPGLKLGLGDFVFYSVLVGQASLYDWITTVSTMVAVTTGLCATIFLLVVYEKPLPALPISILVGITFYLVASLTLTPMIDALLISDSSLFVNGPLGLVLL